MFKRILIAVDGSKTSTKALAAGLQLAKEAGGTARAVHALDELAFISGYEYSAEALQGARKNAQTALDDAMALARAAGVPADQLLADQPGQRLGETIAAAARDWKADLVVVGTHGRRGLGRVVMGSGAEQIVRLSPVPVLVIRSEGD